MKALIVTNIVSANRLYNTENEQSILRRNRNRWAVVLKRTGKTIYNSGNKTFVSDARHPALLPKGSNYSWQCVEAGECLLIEFDAPQGQEEIISFSVSDSSLFESVFAEIQKNLHISSTAAQPLSS